jgi:four helix bundle suffix protein
MTKGFIPYHGGYRKLRSYQKASVIYDATLYFCDRFFHNNRRQTDQMEQAARSGKQNIVEGSLASATSKQTEIHLTNVARASLGELQEDYEDFLRNHQFPLWGLEHPEIHRLTMLAQQSTEENYELYRDLIEHISPEVSANTVRQLLIQASFLLNRQVRRLEQEFLQQGGIRERMTTARTEVKNTPSPGSSSPACPICNAAMAQRTARCGANAGKNFWGCSQYPACKGTRPVLEKAKEP